MLAIIVAGTALWRTVRWLFRGKLQIGSPDFVIDSLGCSVCASVGIAAILSVWGVTIVGLCLMMALTYALRTVWAVMYPERCMPLGETVPAREVI